MKKTSLQIFVTVLICIGFYCGNAFGYSSVVTFGDSLSDNGNVARFTNGKLWVEMLANHFNANLSDFAYGGATTGYDNPSIGSTATGLLWQVSTYSPFVAGLPSTDTLLTVWAGANDLLQGRNPGDAILNIGTALDHLYAAGGRNFIVPNLPDIGKTPALLADPDPTVGATASLWTGAFNTGLASLLQGFSGLHPEVNLYFVDIFDIFNQYTIGTSQWQALFWTDGFHPSSVGHQLIYQAAVNAVNPVPEPATCVLLISGLIGAIAMRRGRKETA